MFAVVFKIFRVEPFAYHLPHPCLALHLIGMSNLYRPYVRHCTIPSADRTNALLFSRDGRLLIVGGKVLTLDFQI
jgi:hypothetical protein